MTKDYLGSRQLDQIKDVLQYGVPGMKWGRRRSSSQLRAAAAQRAESAPSGDTSQMTVLRNRKTGDIHERNPDGSVGKKLASKKDIGPDGVINLKSSPTHSPSGGSESPATRYARLKIQAKAGGASQMSDEDLKFFNARTEALNKVAKMNQTNPGWLSATSKKVLQNTAEQQMQAIAKGIADKYISGPIVDNISKKAAKSAATDTAKKAIGS